MEDGKESVVLLEEEEAEAVAEVEVEVEEEVVVIKDVEEATVLGTIAMVHQVQSLHKVVVIAFLWNNFYLFYLNVFTPQF